MPVTREVVMEVVMERLERANAVRFGHAEVKREVLAGKTTVAEALFDERAQGVKIGHLLCAQHYWGPARTNDLLRPMFISPIRRVGELTDRQKALIGATVTATTSSRAA